MLDSQLTMSALVNAVCQSTYNYCRQLNPVVRVLSVEARHLYLHASTTATHCPALLTAWFNVFGLSKMLPHASSLAFAGASLHRLHVTPVLRQLR